MKFRHPCRLGKLFYAQSAVGAAGGDFAGKLHSSHAVICIGTRSGDSGCQTAHAILPEANAAVRENSVWPV